jgi:purine-binding chemotaxis protein CheW
MSEYNNRDDVGESVDIDEEEDTLKDRYLTFRLGEEDYGIEIQYVTEIVGILKISVVPDMPEFIRGVINLRGKVIPVMGVRERFHMPHRDYDERTCVIVVRMGETSVGLLVDTVKEVIDIPAANVSEPPRVARAESARYFRGIGRVGEEVKILIDVDKLLHEEEQSLISSVAGSHS